MQDVGKATYLLSASPNIILPCQEIKLQRNVGELFFMNSTVFFFAFINELSEEVIVNFEVFCIFLSAAAKVNDSKSLLFVMVLRLESTEISCCEM